MRSPAKARRTISIVSRMRPSGWANGTPCKPSITWGPDAPRPRMNLLPEMRASVRAVIAVMAGVRAPSCMIPDASWMRSVRPARNASGVAASLPHASAVQHTATPIRSASTT
jgi:hypothetical protein